MIIDVQNFQSQTAFPVILGVPYTQAVDMKVKDLTLIECGVDINLTIRELTKEFEKHQDWPGVILIGNHKFYGMITRHHCYEVLGKPFGIEVFSRKTLIEFYNAFEHHDLMIDADTTIQDAVKTALAREKSQIFEPIIACLQENHFKLVNMHILLLAQCDVLEKLYEEFHQLSTIDPLTQLNNRRGFFEFAQPEVFQSQVNQNDLSALMIDIDNFKKTNDLYGHFVGDQVLRIVADEIQKTLRQTDLLGRYGGEEFIALLPNTSVETAGIIAERLREVVEKRTMEINDHQV